MNIFIYNLILSRIIIRSRLNKSVILIALLYLIKVSIRIVEICVYILSYRIELLSLAIPKQKISNLQCLIIIINKFYFTTPNPATVHRV